MLLFKRFWVFPVLFLVFFGCRKPTSANWDVDVVLPLVNSSLNIKNFIGDSIFATDNTGLLYLNINREIANIKLDSLLKLEATTVVENFPVPAFVPTTLQPGVLFTQLPTSPLQFNIGNGAELKRVDIRKGILTVKFSSDIAEPIDFIYKIPNAVKNGQVLTITESVPTGQNSLVRSYDLSGYTFNMTGASGNVYNTILQTYTLGISANGNPVVVNPGQGVKVEISYSEMVPDYVEGYFGKQVIDVPLDTTKIGIINKINAGNFMLSEATMNFKIVNEFGADFSGSLSNIKSINSKQGHVVNLNSNQFGIININAASKVGTTVYPTIKPINLNTANSNVTAFISNLPDKLTYQGTIKLNPVGENSSISGHNDFAFYNTGIRILADINIPLRFTASYFQLRSNAAIDFSSINQLDDVNSGNFVISASNGYPFDAKLQAYLIDESGQVLDSLFTTGANTLERGQMNSLNEVTFPTRSRIMVPVTKDKVEKLRRSKSMQIVSNFTLPPNPPEIKIYENYVFDVNIVAEVNYNVGVNN